MLATIYQDHFRCFSLEIGHRSNGRQVARRTLRVGPDPGASALYSRVGEHEQELGRQVCFLSGLANA